MSDGKYEVPQPGDLDKIRETKESLLGLMPVAGSLVNQLVDTFFASPIEKRRDEWMAEVASGLLLLESEFGILRERLKSNDYFLDVLYNSTAAAAKTSSIAKREYLRNFLLNAALKPDEDESYRKSLLSKLERLEEAHVAIMLRLEETRDYNHQSEFERFDTGPDLESKGVGQIGRDLLAMIADPREQTNR